MFGRKRAMTVHGVRVGRPQAKPTTPTHVRGIGTGHAPGSYERSRGHLPDGTSTAERSTGIAPDRRDPIDPRMPNLSPP